MNVKIKIGVYAVLLILAAWFGWAFHANYTASTLDSAAPPPAVETSVNTATNPPDTNTAVANTNAASPTADASNAVAAVSNPPPAAPMPPAEAAAPPKHSHEGAMIGYLAALILTLIGLGILIANDATQYFGSMAVDALMDDRGEGARDPEYDKAEEIWANGRFLEAIQMMREFLKKNPRAQYASLRIAEIYEKDLQNYLAAALEYEELLKKKLAPERWGWAAIHLCNLYNRLNKQEEAMTLLKRVAEEYPKTGAAKKARSRLGLPEPDPEPMAGGKGDGPAGEPGVAPSQVEMDEEPEPSAEPDQPKSNLPPGFRPK